MVKFPFYLFFFSLQFSFIFPKLWDLPGGGEKESLNFWVCHMDLLAIYEQVSFIPGCFYSYFIISLH